MLDVTSREWDEVRGYLLLPGSFRTVEFSVNWWGGCPAPRAQGSISLMNPNVHAKEGEQSVHGCRVLFRYGPRQGDCNSHIRLGGYAQHVRCAYHRDMGMSPC